LRVVLARSGRALTVPSDVSILDTVQTGGVHVFYEQEQAAGETVMICVSRCKGDRLILDL
jgi:hypothetical protein